MIPVAIAAATKKHPLCVHKTILFVQLLSKHGVNYFDSIRNWDKEKNKLLEAYGFSLSDDLKGKFEFAYKDNKPFLRVLDTSIKRIAPTATGLRPKPVETLVTAAVAEEEELPKAAEMQLGLVFVETEDPYPLLWLKAYKGRRMRTGHLMWAKLKNSTWIIH